MYIFSWIARLPKPLALFTDLAIGAGIIVIALLPVLAVEAWRAFERESPPEYGEEL